MAQARLPLRRNFYTAAAHIRASLKQPHQAKQRLLCPSSRGARVVQHNIETKAKCDAVEVDRGSSLAGSCTHGLVRMTQCFG